MGRKPGALMKRPDISGKIVTDMLEELQQAADLITHVGFVLNKPYGAQWTKRALMLHRSIMSFKLDVQRTASGERPYRGNDKSLPDLPKAFT